MSKTQEDYYKVLQVDPSADPEVVTAAFRRLAVKYHPDTNPSPDANARMQKINEAYGVLSDPAQRAVYDRARRVNGAAHHTATPAEPGPRRGEVRSVQEAESDFLRAKRVADDVFKRAQREADIERDRSLREAEDAWNRAKRAAEETWKRHTREAEIEREKALREAEDTLNRIKRTAQMPQARS